MNVLQPAMLWLLAAVAIPVVIHLYNRKRAVRRRFPAIEFLLASNRKLARRLKVRQLVLLAVRIAVFALLALAIARPYILSDRGTTADEKLPAAVVYVLDDSASMNQVATAGGPSAWDLGVGRALEHLDGLRESLDEAAVVLASDPDDLPVERLTSDHDLVAEAISGHRPTARRGDLTRALEAARDLALSSELPVRRVIVVTDRGRGSWSGSLEDDLFHGSARVELVDVSAGAPNLGLVDASYGRDPAGAADTWQIEAAVQSFVTDEPREATVELVVDGELVASATIEVKPDALAPVTFTHRIDQRIGDDAERPSRVTVRLADGGSLPDDDARHLVIAATRDVRVLLVNGDPRSQAVQDELFFVERALRPGTASRSTLVPRVTTPEVLSDVEIDAADVIVLANVASLRGSQVAALESFVRDGGGLFITLGDRVDPATWNPLFTNLLPKPLRSLKRLADPDDPDAAIKVTRLDRVDYNHAIMRPFALPGGESLQRVEVGAYMLLEPDSRGEAQILASWADGGPALVERTVGAGRVILLTTTLDRDWTNLPLRKTFLPLMQRMTGYLARRTSAGDAAGSIVGEPHRLRLDGYEPERVAVYGPDEDDATPIVLGPTELELDATPSIIVDELGHYRVEVTENGVTFRDPSLAFAANLDPAEADTTPVDAETIAQLWETDPDAVDDDTLAGAGANERRVELWPPLLLTVLILLYLETLVGLRRSFLRRLRMLRSA